MTASAPLEKGKPVYFMEGQRRVTGTVTRTGPRASVVRLDDDGKEYKISNDKLVIRNEE